MRPRVALPACGKEIAWYDNIPVLSWLSSRDVPRLRRADLAASTRWSSSPPPSSGSHGRGATVPRSRRSAGAVFGTLLLGHRHDRCARLHHPRRVHHRRRCSVIGLRAVSLAGSGSAGAHATPPASARRSASACSGLVGYGRDLALQGGRDGRRRHQDDGDGRRLRGLAGVLLTIFLGALVGQPGLRPARAHGPEEAGALRHLPRDRCRHCLPLRARLVQWYSATYLGVDAPGASHNVWHHPPRRDARLSRRATGDRRQPESRTPRRQPHARRGTERRAELQATSRVGAPHP